MLTKFIFLVDIYIFNNYTVFMSKSKSYKLVSIAVFASLIAVGGMIKINLFAVPFTMQTFFVIFAALTLNWKNAIISVSIYLFAGLIGLPVFVKGGGIYYVFEPSFGYLLGFLFAAPVASVLARKRKTVGYLLATVSALLIVYTFGSFYFYFISKFYLSNPVTVEFILIYCVLIFLPSDATFAIIACIISARLNKYAFYKNIY